MLTVEIDELTTEITERVTSRPVAAGHRRLRRVDRSQDRRRDRPGGPVPLQRRLRPTQRHRTAASLVVKQTATPLSRTGNRQLNAALHRIALTQHGCTHPHVNCSQRRKNNGDGGMEALRVLKRRLSDVVYRAMLTDQNQSSPAAA